MDSKQYYGYSGNRERRRIKRVCILICFSVDLLFCRSFSVSGLESGWKMCVFEKKLYVEVCHGVRMK